MKRKSVIFITLNEAMTQIDEKAAAAGGGYPQGGGINIIGRNCLFIYKTFTIRS